MKGRKSFSKSEEKRLRMLISKKVNSSRQEQKVIRQALRNMDFYISDWTKSNIEWNKHMKPRPNNPFSLKHLELLKNWGYIRII